jgi:toxin ParE1/3/4
MRRRIAIRPRADLDVEATFIFISTDSTEAALRFLDAVRETIESVADHPESGRPRRFTGHGGTPIWSRQVSGFRTHLIFYSMPDEHSVTIIRVLHGAMNLEAIFADEEE